jgi:hypothetical protein
MDYDRSTGELVLLVGSLLLRARTDASDAAYHYDWMDLDPVAGSGLGEFADVGSLNGGRMTVTDSGITYIMESGGGTVDNPIHKVDAAGTETLDFLTSTARNGGDIVAFGEELVFGGSAASPTSGTFIEHWNDTGSPTQIFSESITYYYGVAAEAVDVTKLYFSKSSGTGPGIRKTVNGTTSTLYASAKTTLILYDPVSTHLLYARGCEVRRIRSDNQADELIYRIPGAGIVDLAVDATGAIYATCVVPGLMIAAVPYPPGAVWKILGDGSKARAVVDDFTYLRQAAIDPDLSQEEIVMLSLSGKLYRTNVTSP